MPPSASSTLHSPLTEQDGVRIRMEDQHPLEELEMQQPPTGRSESTLAEPAEDSIATEKTHKPKIWNKGHPYVYFWEPPKKDSWETLKKGINKYDDEMCRAWNGELDTILTFAGLFSAAVTAFCIESFHALSQNSVDTTNIFLLAISQQLANSSAPVASMSMAEGFIPNTYDIHMNILYFVSLALALSVSSVCILGKQWIREYQKDLSVSPCDAVRVRQVRFDSLEAWKVPQIMASLPLVLLIALMLFFSGLLIQLWNVNDHTTAAMVTFVVSLTAVLVIVTTIVPGCISMQPSRSSFAPFRSPQSWIFFLLFRRFQRWYHHFSDRYVWDRYPPILSSWSEFDLDFLEMETKEWFDHNISSVHRALRWVVKVLRNSSEMETSFLWCLQSKPYPQYLIRSENALCHYALLGSNEADGTDNLDRAYYDYSRLNEGFHKIDSTAGQRQAESLIRSAHHVLDELSSSAQRQWDAISYACDRLWYRGIFESYSAQEIVYHQHVVQDQVALLFQRIFTTSLPPPLQPFDWDDTVLLLLNARRDSSSQLSGEIFYDVINQQIPAWIRHHKSASLLYGISNEVRYRAAGYSEHAIELFTCMDKVMVEFCSDPEDIEGLDEEGIRRWRNLRMRFVEELRDPRVPEQFRLPTAHFDDLPGHGPLPSLPSFQLQPLSLPNGNSQMVDQPNPLESTAYKMEAKDYSPA